MHKRFRYFADGRDVSASDQSVRQARETLSWRLLVGGIALAIAMPAALWTMSAQAQTPKASANSDLQKSIDDRLTALRSTPDEKRGAVTKQIALDIRRLTDPKTRLNLASSLANLATEGDFGHDTLQAVATTLSDALKAAPMSNNGKEIAYPYITLAQLARYEGVRVSLNAPQYQAAMAQLKAQDVKRETSDFELNDVHGKAWSLKELRGKVVLVNFWATWCPPCRKELPDLDAMYKKFKDKGLVILGITDEKADIVNPFLAKNPLSYPILLDTGRKVNELYEVQGIPRTLIYDRNGKLAAQAIDMRTQKQLMALLEKAKL